MMMIRSIWTIILLIVLSVNTISAQDYNWYNSALKTAEQQIYRMAQESTPGNSPRSIKKGEVRTAPCKDWTCGFFPGSLWYLYELSGDKKVKIEAERYTDALSEIPNYTYTHDLGFMINCSFGNGYRLTHNREYRKAMLKGAESLSSRFNNTVGCIRSWNFGPWQFPVIIDNMMNLEFLLQTSKLSHHNNHWKEIAISHADKTLANHFRSNYSTYHVVEYDTISGKKIKGCTHQGYSDNSAWARGQSWGLYGYTVMYRYTHNTKYLDQAEHIALFMMNNPQMPKDKIPYWDFDAPNIPNAPRDASAAAIMASALLELSQYSNSHKDKYLSYAESILQSLSSDTYLAKKDSNKHFILKHSVGALPGNSEIDTPLNYADYYYLEAMKRYAELRHINTHKILKNTQLSILLSYHSINTLLQS